MSSLSKMLSVLDLFGPQRLKIDPDTIAEHMGLSRATVYRYVKDLCDARDLRGRELARGCQALGR